MLVINDKVLTSNPESVISVAWEKQPAWVSNVGSVGPSLQPDYLLHTIDSG